MFLNLVEIKLLYNAAIKSVAHKLNKALPAPVFSHKVHIRIAWRALKTLGVQAAL